ncbi:Uncharacterised protein [Yersinia aldovae]|uniref:Uncharacterized protein n=1 Tax=Yersinia aldovae TaxID=29483 RepID=A0A0T9TFX9_YERAL|nr:Uncharacterised protein [Yersinia aldovae]
MMVSIKDDATTRSFYCAIQFTGSLSFIRLFGKEMDLLWL